MRQLLRRIGHVVFALLAALALYFGLQVGYGVLDLVGKPFLAFTLTDEGFVNPVSLGVWGADRAGLRRWDRIVAVDGQLVFSARFVRQEALQGEVPRPVTYQVEGVDGEHRFVQIPTRRFTPSDIVKSQAAQALLGLIFVAIAILLYVLRPGTAEAWTFFLFFASLGVAMSSVVDLTMLWRMPPIYPHIGPFLGVFGLILVGNTTGAYTRAMRRDPRARWLRRLMWTLTLVSVSIALGLSLALYASLGNMRRYLFYDNLMYSWLALATLLGLGALIIAYRRSKSIRRRARLRQILWAWPVGAGIPSVSLFLGHVLEMSGVSLLWNGFVILVPLSTADAIVRHDLLDLSNRARRLIGGMTVAAVVGTALGFLLWAAVQFLNLTDAAGMVALAALLFAVAAPVTHRVQRYIDQLLRSAPYDAGRLLADFTGRASTARHLADVTSQLEQTLTASILPSGFELFRLDPYERRLLPEVGASRGLAVTHDLEYLLDRSDPALFDDDEPAPAPLGDAAIALRLAVANEAVGMLVLSQRSDNRAYEAGDVAFISSLAGPLAAALVNTRAYERVEAMNAELEARVQARTAELQNANAELAFLNQRKDELVATVSHDFRSPLAIIRQNVQTILRDLSDIDSDDLRHFLEGVARQEARLTSMCTNLLDLAKLKHAPIAHEEVDVAQLAKGMLQGFELKASQAQVQLTYDCAEDAPTHIQGDPERLSQVLQNLLDNAIKFTPAGGSVGVSLTRQSSLTSTLPRLRIDISDTGYGIPAADIPRIFEPFFQVPRQTHVGQGSGLGLAIAKAVIDTHHGEISVDSDDGKGTRFTVLLKSSSHPSRRDDAALPALSTDPSPSQTSTDR